MYPIKKLLEWAFSGFGGAIAATIIAYYIASPSSITKIFNGPVQIDIECSQQITQQKEIPPDKLAAELAKLLPDYKKLLEVAIPEPQAPEPELPSVPEIFTISFDGFVVLSSVDPKRPIYLNADLSIDTVNPESADFMKKYQAYIRSIIYEGIERALDANGKTKIKVAFLQKAVRDALNEVLPGRGVGKIVFTNLAIS